MSSDDVSSDESIESDPEETTSKSLESSSKSNENNKTQIKTEKQNSIIPNDRTTGTYKKGNANVTKHKKKHYKNAEEDTNDDSLKSKSNTEFYYEKFPKKSNKDIHHHIHIKRGSDAKKSKRQTSTDLQEAPALKYKKVTCYVGLISLHLQPGFYIQLDLKI